MDKVLVQEQVHTLLNGHYVSIKLDLDRERSLARKYRVGGIPALLFFDKQGTLVERINGFVPMESLVSTLKKIS
jgi:thioredoxin-related protein